MPQLQPSYQSNSAHDSTSASAEVSPFWGTRLAYKAPRPRKRRSQQRPGSLKSIRGAPAPLSAAQPVLAEFALLMMWQTPRPTPASGLQSADVTAPVPGPRSEARPSPVPAPRSEARPRSFAASDPSSASRQPAQPPSVVRLRPRRVSQTAVQPPPSPLASRGLAVYLATLSCCCVATLVFVLDLFSPAPFGYFFFFFFF